MAAVGAGKDSPGSDALIAAVDRDDRRPLWVPVWGGPNVLAQALWKVRATRSPDALARFVSKLRVYTISDQDDSGPWIRKTFPDLFYIASPGLHAGGAYHFATWSGISGDNFHARFTGADFSIVDNPWLEQHIRRKGPLGAQYPPVEFLMEGDTPSFLGLVNNGLNVPEHPEWGGWGGRYERYTPRTQKWFQEPETRPFWTDAVDEVRGADGRWHTSNHATIWRWRAAYQNDFAARMDWTIQPYEKANHPPVPKLSHANALSARPGERVQLNAEGSTDPDGDALSYEWFYYGEPGTFTTSSGRTGQPVVIQDFDRPRASFTVPTERVMPPGTGTMHIILAVTDDGTPRLTRYRRVIVTVARAVADCVVRRTVPRLTPLRPAVRRHRTWRRLEAVQSSSAASRKRSIRRTVSSAYGRRPRRPMSRRGSDRAHSAGSAAAPAAAAGTGSPRVPVSRRRDHPSRRASAHVRPAPPRRARRQSPASARRPCRAWS